MYAGTREEANQEWQQTQQGDMGEQVEDKVVDDNKETGGKVTGASMTGTPMNPECSQMAQRTMAGQHFNTREGEDNLHTGMQQGRLRGKR